MVAANNLEFEKDGPQDTADRIDYARLARVTHGLQRVVATLVTDRR